ncbi:MAG: hypothetical protein AB7P69_17865 [Candidatus Binatia bacterium]
MAIRQTRGQFWLVVGGILSGLYATILKILDWIDRLQTLKDFLPSDSSKNNTHIGDWMMRIQSILFSPEIMLFISVGCLFFWILIWWKTSFTEHIVDIVRFYNHLKHYKLRWPIVYQPQDISPQVHIGRMMANFRQLEDDGYIQFTIVVICCKFGLTLERAIFGHIYYLGEQSVKLDPPQIESSSDFTLRKGESFITLRQHVPRVLALEIIDILKKPEYRFQFHFLSLTLNIISPELGPERLNLWDGMTCFSGVSFGRVLNLQTSGLQVSSGTIGS